MIKIFIKTDFEQRFFKEGPFDGLVVLIIEILSDDISKFLSWVRVDIFLFLNHDIQIYFS